MSNEWLTPQQAAERLGCAVETIRGMLRCELLPGEKSEGQWRIRTAEVEEFRGAKTSASASASEPLCEVDAGMVEVSIALAGVTGAVAGLLPNLLAAKWLVVVLAGVASILSSYSALWLLARFCLKGESAAGFSAAGLSEVAALILSPRRVGPYWFLALGLLFWFVLSIVVFQLLLSQVL